MSKKKKIKIPKLIFSCDTCCILFFSILCYIYIQFTCTRLFGILTIDKDDYTHRCIKKKKKKYEEEKIKNKNVKWKERKL